MIKPRESNSKKVICNRKESFNVYKKHFKDISLKKR